MLDYKIFKNVIKENVHGRKGKKDIYQTSFAENPSGGFVPFHGRGKVEKAILI